MRIRATYTVTKEYEVDLKNYPKGATFPEGVIKIDKVGIMDDPEGYFSEIDSEHLSLEAIED